MRSLFWTGVFDGDLSGGTPKAVELYATQDISDLSLWSLSNYNNGGSSASNTTTLSGATTAGSYLYISSDSNTTNFNTWFGFNPTFTGSSPGINGDDAVGSLLNGTLVDVFGSIGTDGTGQIGRTLMVGVYRNSDTGPSTTFSITDWTVAEDAYDGFTSNSGATLSAPVGTFTVTAVPEPSTYAVGILALVALTAFARRRRRLAE